MADTFGSQVKAAREARGWSQRQLAYAVGVSQQTIAKIEAGTTSFTRHSLRIASFLDITPREYNPNAQEGRTLPVMNDKKTIPGDVVSIFPLLLGPEGQWTDRSPPVMSSMKLSDNHFVGVSSGYYLAEDAMSPVYEPGDIILISTYLPVIKGTDCIFYNNQSDSSIVLVSLRKFIGSDDENWHVLQWNPQKEIRLPKALWTGALRVAARVLRR